MNFKISLLLCFLTTTAFSQKTELSSFENLIGKTWKAEGKWGDGSKFSQEVYFEFTLDSSLVISNTKGIVDDTHKLSPRSHGVRQFDKASNSIKFWEFTFDGAKTFGNVVFDGKNIIYQYRYKEAILTDMWEYVNDTTYNYKVGNYMNGIWIQTYLNTTFTQIETRNKN